MANPNFCYDESTARNSLSGGGGVCMMRNSWRDEQHPLFVNFISAFLGANSFRLNFVPIDPDLIFNCGGLSVAFIFVTKWDCSNISSTFLRVQKLKGQFANLYVIVTLSNKDQNDSFVRSYFKYEMDIGKPTFVPVQDMEMGFEKIVRIALARGVCKRQNAVSKLRNERKRSVQTMEAFLKVVATIPTIDTHDANSLNQAIGSIEDLSKASKEYILQSTDLSADKAEMITKFFRDSEFYLSPHIQKETM